MNLIFILILQESTLFNLMELKKSKKKKQQLDLDNTVYSVYLARHIFMHGWIIEIFIITY